MRKKELAVDNIMLFGGLVILTAALCTLVLNPIHKKNIQKLSKPPLITCNQCKGSGEYLTDINKLMMDASLALYLNYHIMIDKCEKCVKLPYGDGYEYCEAVNQHYQTLLKEYAAAVPKIDMAACDKCMGMGQFTSVKKDGSYLTQEEYNKTHEQNK
jgi:hypothetical protein